MKRNLTPDEEFHLYRAFAAWPKERKYEYIQKCSKEQAFRLKYTWPAWARDHQLAPQGRWATWVLKAGRGFGKTRAGAEWVLEKAKLYPGCHIALVGRTVADVRDVMVTGRSGILAVSPPWFAPLYIPSKRLIKWPNGAHATTYSADSPDQLRGPQHSFAWSDERAAWQYDDAFDQLLFGLRIIPAKGIEPQCVVTTTPRNTKAMKELVRDPTTVVTSGKTSDNRDNLSGRFLHEIERKYSGTRLGRQEIDGEIIDDLDGALWKRAWIEENRVVTIPALKRIIVAIDPPGSSSATSEEPAQAGIIVAGLGMNEEGYLLADYSLSGTPHEWASAALTAYNVYHADCLVAEVNFGGEMVEYVMKSIAKENGMRSLPFKAVHASRGKQLRAEPVSNLYQQRRVHHVGTFPDLEDQLCNWLPGEKSPDRLDAAVWALTDLMVKTELTAEDHLRALEERLNRTRGI